MRKLCTSFKEIPANEALKRSFERAKIESSRWDIKKTLGFGEYRVRESEAAIVHSHLVLLTDALLLILKKRMEAKKQSSNYTQRRHLQVGQGQMPHGHLRVDRAYVQQRNEHEEHNQHAKTSDTHIIS